MVPPNVTKVQSNVMLVLLKVIMEPLNVRGKKKKKKKGTTKCNKITIAYDVGTTQCDDRTNKCEKK